MKPRYTVIIFCLILASAMVSSMGSYRQARQLIVDDMDNALQLTLAAKHDLWLTPDTIRDYRRNLQIDMLRDVSFIGYDMAYSGLHTEARTRRLDGQQASYRSYASCSPLMVLSLSDQRLPAVLWMVVMVWGIVVVGQHRRRQTMLPSALPTTPQPTDIRDQHLLRIGTLSYDADSDLFFDSSNSPVRLTPMQLQFMRMLFLADRQRLSKQDICDRLWPKKPDASDTLYTLVRRLKPIVEQCSNLQITSDRGRGYELTVRESSM